MSSNAASSFELSVELTKLAAEPESEKRVELLRRIADAYGDKPERRTAAERYFFDEVIGALVDKIGGKDRAAAAATLAALPEIPDPVAEKLGGDDDIEVARPILRNYRGLSERTLLHLARRGSQDHLYEIAGRETVTPPVTDVVVERGDHRVVRTLAANTGAQFSSQGMERLIAKAKADGDLQAVIAARGDLTIGQITKLLPLISDELASRLRSTGLAFDEAQIREHLGEWAKNRKQNVERTNLLIERIKRHEIKLNDVVIDLVRAKRLFDAAAVVGSMTGFDRFYMFHILTVGDIEQTMLLLRSVDLSWPVAEAFLNLRIDKAGIGKFDRMPGREEYVAIDAQAAQRVVRFMKVRQAAQQEAQHEAKAS